MKLSIKTTLQNLTQEKQIFLKQKLEKAALETFNLSESKLEEISLYPVSNLLDNKLVSITIQDENIGQNAGKKLYEFKRISADILSSFYTDFKMENLQTNVERQPIKKQKPDISEQKYLEDEYDYEKKSRQFIPEAPLYSFDRVILADKTKRKIEESLAIVLYEQKVFNDWGLYEIQPHPSSCLSFYGPSGTGKTMAAEAVAQKLGRKILKVSYADVESKYHGEGPKMIKAIFLAAQNNDAVLFFDEADSLLSKRLTNVTQGSEQAINSMRSQILICLEQFHGIVIFATNLVVNYDKAFLTRLISVEFKIPGIEERKKIWNVHLKAPQDGKAHKLNIPLAPNMDIDALSTQYEFVGREIRNAVIKACVKAAMDNKNLVEQSDFISACDVIAREKDKLTQAEENATAKDAKMKDAIKQAIAGKVRQAGVGGGEKTPTSETK